MMTTEAKMISRTAWLTASLTN